LKIQNRINRKIDRILILLYILLLLIGWISIYSVNYSEETSGIFDIQLRHGKQLLWILISILTAFFILVIDSRFFSFFAYIIYSIFLVLLILVIFFGPETHGTHSWFKIGGGFFQPSEFAKFATALAVSKHLSTRAFSIKDKKSVLIFSMLVFLPMVIIIVQNDMGTALVYSVLFLLLFRFGLEYKYLLYLIMFFIIFLLSIIVNVIILISVVCFLILLFYYFKKGKRYYRKILILFFVVTGFVLAVDYSYNKLLDTYQKHRINTLLGIDTDPMGAGYNVNQSKIAIGSGGFTGKGFLQGTQTKYDFVPEQSTDFIFCTIGEEWGFLGSSLVILIFLGFLIRIILVAERQNSFFSRIYGYSVALIIFFHFFVNIGMSIGIAPVIGIPLPFISYGGSSLLAYTILLFVFLRFDSEKQRVIV